MTKLQVIRDAEVDGRFHVGQLVRTDSKLTRALLGLGIVRVLTYGPGRDGQALRSLLAENPQRLDGLRLGRPIEHRPPEVD